MHGTQNRIARRPRHKFEIPTRVAERALTRYVLDVVTGCHISTYSTASHGYAQIGWQDPDYRQVVVAHRAAWVAVHGQIPEGLTIDHTCKNKPCVNVEHLRLLDNFENGRRTAGRDWPLGECAQGHPNSHLKLYANGVGKSPRLRCQICQVAAQRKYDMKMRTRRL